MPPKRKSGGAAGVAAVANGTNGFHSDAELTPPPAISIQPSESQKEAIVDEAVSNVLRKRRRTNPVSYIEKEAESDAEQDEQDLEDLAIEAEDVAQKAAAIAASITPRKGRGAAKSGTKSRTPRKTAAQKRKEEEEEAYDDDGKPDVSEEEEHEAVEEKTTPKRKGGRKKAAAANGDQVTPAKSTPAKRLAQEASSSPLTDEDDNDDGTTPKKGKGKKKTPKKPTPKKSRLAVDEPEYDEDGNEIIKKKRKPKVYPKIEYDIPDVERLETTFKGRLGYACLNTVLRSTKPDSIFCSRTCRIASILEEGMELPKGLALMNCRDLLKMIEWNEQNNIRFMRLSSEMFPFASHKEYGYTLEFADKELKEAGELARKYGHRLTMHPGQFTQIGSPKNAVVDASVRELEYQCEIMDRMGLDKDGVMIIHMGGIYGDKESTLARFKENYTTKLSDSIKARLVLENDEICYNVDDLLPVCNELDIPIIFDYHHDWIHPSSKPPAELIPLIKQTWDKKGIKMKQHLSEPRPGAETVMERRAHADRCKRLPPDLPDDVDLMIEAKDKEQAVFELYRIYNLAPVIHDNLRPPDPAPSMQTKGRKSSLKKKTKDTGEVDEDGNSIKLEDVEKEGDGEVGDEGASDTRLEEVDEATKAEVEVKAEEEAFNGEGVEAIPTALNGANRDGEAKPEPPQTAGAIAAMDVKAEAAAVPSAAGNEAEAKPKRGRPRRSGASGKAKP